MAIAFNALANMSTSTAGAESYAGTAGTPAAGDLLICMVAATATTAAGGMTGQWTWTKLTSFTYNSGVDSMYVFWAYASAATATTPTFTCTGDAATACEIYCLRVTGSSGIQVPCICQFKTATGASTNPPVTMYGAINTNNGCISLVAENGTQSSGSTFTAPTGWGAAVQAGTGTSPRHATAVSSRVSGETGSTITWTKADSSPWGLIVMEICLLGGRQMSPSGGAYSSPMFY